MDSGVICGTYWHFRGPWNFFDFKGCTEQKRLRSKSYPTLSTSTWVTIYLIPSQPFSLPTLLLLNRVSLFKKSKKIWKFKLQNTLHSVRQKSTQKQNFPRSFCWWEFLHFWRILWEKVNHFFLILNSYDLTTSKPFHLLY